MAFTGNLTFTAFSPAELRQRRAKSALFRVDQSFAFMSPSAGYIEVLPGLISDFASVPRTAHWYVDKDSPAILYGSIIHDYLYRVAGKLPGGRTLTRRQCDEVLREAMVACGARPSQARVVYWSVRAGGWISFGKGHEPGITV